MVNARRKDLDAWAEILEVDNDTDAMAALSNYYGRLLVVAGELNWLQKRFETSGVVGGDDVLVSLNDAATDTLNAAEAAAPFLRASRAGCRVMWGRRNLDLDAWAGALGVSNDADGIAAIRRLDSEIEGVIADLNRLKNKLPDAVRGGTYADEAKDFVGTAAEGLYETRDCLKTISDAFARHERGDS